jgi:hypothetical protein
MRRGAPMKQRLTLWIIVGGPVLVYLIGKWLAR